MRPFSRRGLLVLLLCFAAARSRALGRAHPIEQYGLDTWTSRDGLPQNSVNVILQTRDGYLWLGTEEGLVRFDGVRFTVYSSRTVPAFRQNTVETLVETADGDLWIGTADGLLRRHGEEFTAYRKKDGLPDDSITALAITRDGKLWIGTETGGLAGLSDDRIFTASDRASGLPDNRIISLAPAGDGSLWIGLPSGLARLQAGRLTSYAVAEGAEPRRINSIRESKDGTLWAASSRGLIHVVGDRVAASWTSRDGLPESVLGVLLEDRNGSVWVGAGGATAAGGLARMHGGRIERFGSAQGLPPDAHVISLFEDREGSLWIGTVGKGLLRYRPAAVRTYSHLDGLTNDYVHTVLEAPDGTVWVGTRGGGVNAIRNGVFAGAVTEKNGLPSDFVTSLGPAADGSLWVGTVGGGIARITGGTARRLPPAAGLPTAGVRAVLEDRAGALWIGTSGDGLARYENGAVRNFRTRDGLAGDDVDAICEDRDGALWVGTKTGLSRWRNGAWTTYRERNGLSSEAVRSLRADADGTLWIGTSGGGLIRLRDGRFSVVTARNGLFDDVIFTILDDERGNLWMSCNRGIFRVARRDLENFFAGKQAVVASKSYGEADGMKSAECNGSFQPSGWRSRDGGLWFSTIQGVAVIRPGAIRANAHEPPVIIERVLVDGRERPLDASLVIAPGSRSLQLDFTGLSFLAPDKMQFRYQLEGFDAAWVEAGTRRVAYYTNLPPRSYRFRVIAANADGVWNRKGSRTGVLDPTEIHADPVLRGARDSRRHRPGIRGLPVPSPRPEVEGAGARAGDRRSAVEHPRPSRALSDLRGLQEDPRRRRLLEADRELHPRPLRGGVLPLDLPGLHGTPLPGVCRQGGGRAERGREAALLTLAAASHSTVPSAGLSIQRRLPHVSVTARGGGAGRPAGRPADIAATKRATVGWSKRRRMDTSTSMRERSRAIACIAPRESPPRSKKSSWTPIREMARTSLQIAATVCSRGVRRSQRRSESSSGRSEPGGGSARRSTFPFGSRGRLSRGT